MPLLEVTGGPIAPAGKTLAVGTRLVAIYDSPYVDGIYSYPTNHFAELDLTTGLWKPQGAPDETQFYLPGGADTYPVPPRTTLHEVQVYDDSTQQSFVRGPLTIIETAAGEWFYPTPAQNVKYLDNPTVPPANAVLQSERNIAGGFAGLDANGLVVPRLSYEDEPDGLAKLDSAGLIPYGITSVAKTSVDLALSDFLYGKLAGAPGTIRATLEELIKVFGGEIVQQGGTSASFWIRWASGMQICAHARSDLGAVNSAFGSGYILSATSQAWPAAFIERPVNLAFARKGTGNAPIWAAGSTSWGTETSTPTIWLNVWVSVADTQNGLEYLAIGRWK